MSEEKGNKRMEYLLDAFVSNYDVYIFQCSSQTYLCAWKPFFFLFTRIYGIHISYHRGFWTRQFMKSSKNEFYQQYKWWKLFFSEFTRARCLACQQYTYVKAVKGGRAEKLLQFKMRKRRWSVFLCKKSASREKCIQGMRCDTKIESKFYQVNLTCAVTYKESWWLWSFETW